MALSDASIQVVKATAPAVAANAVNITTTFYRTMFGNNPEVLAFFNRTNQERGRQQEALADAVVAYALNIDNLGALGSLVERIAQRHVALSITPEMYATVHKNLMLAIGEVLGEAVTPEVGGAWSEAVLALATICIGRENDLRRECELRTGGWSGERRFKIQKKDAVAEDTVAFTFEAADGYNGGFDFLPGQYLTVRVPGLEAAPRHYTLTSRPGDKVLECTIRRVPGGRMSNHMHDEVEVGTDVLLGPPCGVYTLDKREGPKVLISAGIGLTPSRNFLHQFSESAGARLVYHVERTEARHAYRAEFESTGAKCIWHYTQKDGHRPELAKELKDIVGAPDVGADADFYVCGPISFMADVGNVLAELGATKVHTEVFGTGQAPKSKCPAAALHVAGGSCPFAH